jgi:hypothetical protein
MKKGEKMNTKKLIDEVVSLPIEERAMVIDSILRSLNQPITDLDKKWLEEARQRLSEMRQKKGEAISGNQVFEKIWRRFNK